MRSDGHAYLVELTIYVGAALRGTYVTVVAPSDTWVITGLSLACGFGLAAVIRMSVGPPATSAARRVLHGLIALLLAFSVASFPLGLFTLPAETECYEICDGNDWWAWGSLSFLVALGLLTFSATTRWFRQLARG